ncbi:hypothetical protein H8R18_05735 [Nanchangia anserum]|uniref:DUF4439 domain-containing protein n=1 Tax=Nanchangia anserum TaxID=2692125 RepID=A0A8I0G8E2_9ACTO|nr:hypothetical protein [Nanchangia anserum]MBD3689039.1 hypothetical protein [Nanchangia anserum]QOX81283.1 hypothetical protein H8R18_05735 [Nanchangia anserum]
MISLTRLSALTVTALAVAAATTGCQLRIDSQASPFRELSSSDVARYQAAVCDQQVADVLAHPGEIPADAAAPIADVAARATQRLQAFGQPWTFPSEAGSEVPAAPPTREAPATAQAAVTRLVTCASQAGTDATVVEDRGLAKLLVSAAAARRQEALRLAQALGIAMPGAETITASSPLVLDEDTGKYRAPSAQERQTMEPAESEAATPSASEAKALGESVAELDSARYDLEQAASRLSSADKQQAIALADQLAYEIDVLVDEGAPDTRQLEYGRLDLSDPAARAHEAVSAALAAQYRLIEATDRPAIRERVVVATAAASQVARSWGVEDSALPGLTVTTPASVLPRDDDH